MDKIFTQEFEAIFSHQEHQLLYQGGRYAEVVSRFEEAGLATATISSITTPGMSLSTFSMASERKLLLVDSLEKEATQAVFSLNGGIESRFQTMKHPIHILHKSHSLQYNSNFQGTHLLQTGRFEALVLNFELPFVKSLVQQPDCRSEESLANSLEQKRVFMPVPVMLEMPPRLSEIVETLRQNPFQGITRYVFMEAKILELFALQLDQISSLSQQSAKQSISLPDREKLKAVRDFIVQHYLQPLKLSELARQFGLNEFKLKKGYKQLFQTTVFGHIHQLRMGKAKELLAQRHMNVSEVADFIGYQNIGSFSAEFKKRFGSSPSQY